MKKRHEGQEASRANKLFTPCRNEKRHEGQEPSQDNKLYSLCQYENKIMREPRLPPHCYTEERHK